MQVVTHSLSLIFNLFDSLCGIEPLLLSSGRIVSARDFNDEIVLESPLYRTIQKVGLRYVNQSHIRHGKQKGIRLRQTPTHMHTCTENDEINEL